MSKIKNLGKTLSKKQQRGINGGVFCIIHCYDECLSAGFSNGYCVNSCQQQAAENGGGGF